MNCALFEWEGTIQGKVEVHCFLLKPLKLSHRIAVLKNFIIFRVNCSSFVLIFSKLQANLDDTCERKVKLDCPMYSKQKN